MPKGPRVHFKRDDESSVGRGAVLHAAHFRPEIASMIWAFARSCPSWVAEVWVTEGYRSIRKSRDLHEECRALDFTARRSSGFRPLVDEYELIAQACRALLGPDYDIITHGDGANLHVHMELDP